MAALEYNDDEDGVIDANLDPILTWNWATWPDNLRKAAIATVAVIALVIAVIALLRWADKDLSRKLKAQNTIKQTALSKVQNSDQERRDIDTNLPLLRQLEAANIFGDEKRLEWVEFLRNIEKRWPGIRIQYAIAAQSLVASDAAAAPATAAPATPEPSEATPKNFGVFNTEMRLTLSLLHEGDALAIIEELQAAGLGRFKVRYCSFRRLTSDNPNQSAMTNFGRPVESECVLTWISMRPYAAN